MFRYDPVEIIKKTNFGEIDGLNDPYLQDYFIDEDYWKLISENNKFFILGRKGTGKSALYSWLDIQSNKNGFLSSNLSFHSFPFEKLLQLDDKNFSAPNQYEVIWECVILSELAKLVVIDERKVVNDELKSLIEYVDLYFGKDLKDIHVKIIQNTNRTEMDLKYYRYANENVKVVDKWNVSLYMLNRKLKETIYNYLITAPTANYLIQFDQLDDNYNQYIDNSLYYQCILSLMKVVYSINKELIGKNIATRIVVYLRTDIYTQLHRIDAESARWKRNVYILNWSISTKMDWNNSRLEKMINKRFNVSYPDLNNPFRTIFDNRYINLKSSNGRYIDPFKYIIDRTMHRPRDLVQFLIEIQDMVNEKNYLDYRIVKAASIQYGIWLHSEIENEIGVLINDVSSLYKFLRLLGKGIFSVTDFKLRYKSFESLIKYDPEKLLDILYDFGIILNVDNSIFPPEYYSKVRNEGSSFNRDFMITIHKGYLIGLYSSNSKI